MKIKDKRKKKYKELKIRRLAHYVSIMFVCFDHEKMCFEGVNNYRSRVRCLL